MIDHESKGSFVRPLLQLETVTSVLVIRSDKQFSFQIALRIYDPFLADRINGRAIAQCCVRL